MQPSRAMQAVVTEIATNHGLDLRNPGSCLRLKQAGYQPLVIEVLHPNLVHVAHTYEPVPGKTQPDPGVAFFTGYALWVPIEVNQPIGGYRIYASLSAGLDDIVAILPGRQADLAQFTELWARNIRAQGWLDEGVTAQNHEEVDDVPF